MIRNAWIVVAVTLFTVGCVTQDQLDQLNQTLQETKDAVAAQPDSPQKAKTVAVLDEAGKVISTIPVEITGESIIATGQAVAPLTDGYAPWVTLITGALGTYLINRRQREREDKLYDEALERGASGQVNP